MQDKMEDYPEAGTCESFEYNDGWCDGGDSPDDECARPLTKEG